MRGTGPCPYCKGSIVVERLPVEGLTEWYICDHCACIVVCNSSAEFSPLTVDCPRCNGGGHLIGTDGYDAPKCARCLATLPRPFVGIAARTAHQPSHEEIDAFLRNLVLYEPPRIAAIGRELIRAVELERLRSRLDELERELEGARSPDGRDGEETGDSDVLDSEVADSDSLELYPWQIRALDSWWAADSKGVVEAVTGSGKTRVAIAAAADTLDRGGRVAIVVPSKELMYQWHREVHRLLPRVLSVTPRIGLMGDDSYASLEHVDLLIATVQSASKYQLSPPSGSLLIADECHRYGGNHWCRALENGFAKRMGLTATYEREDNGVEEYLDPYFSGVCYSVGYEEALQDGVIAGFKLAFVGAPFNEVEDLAYREAAERAAHYRSKLIREWQIPAEPFGDFMAAVCRLKAADVQLGSKLASFYLSAFAKRRAVMAEARGKFLRMKQLCPAVVAAERTIAFAQTKDAARRVVDVLSTCGVRGSVLTSDMDMDERHAAFAAFEMGNNDLIAAPRLLDEGIDVPAADLALILASSRSKRQLIQRMGRVVRKKNDGRLARIVVFYIEGTAEDPETGANEDFLEFVTSAATDIQIFPSSTESQEIVTYLNDWFV